jgi:hypothetical protein
MDQDQVARGKRVAMSFVAVDRPHLHVEERSGVLAVSFGEVEDEVPDPRRVPPSPLVVLRERCAKRADIVVSAVATRSKAADHAPWMIFTSIFTASRFVTP